MHITIKIFLAALIKRLTRQNDLVLSLNKNEMYMKKIIDATCFPSFFTFLEHLYEEKLINVTNTFKNGPTTFLNTFILPKW